MIHPKVISTVAAILLVSGCAAMTPEPSRMPNPRIVYRDLTRPKAYPVPAMPEPPKPEAKTPVPEPANKPLGFVEFANDSYKKFDEKAAEEFAETADKDALIMVFGHSHGRSAVGTRELSTRRAERIALYLRRHGFNDVNVMASWGGRGVPFCPPRGVQLYALESGEDAGSVQIAFSKIIEKESEKNNEKSVQDHLVADKRGVVSVP